MKKYTVKNYKGNIVESLRKFSTMYDDKIIFCKESNGQLNIITEDAKQLEEQAVENLYTIFKDAGLSHDKYEFKRSGGSNTEADIFAHVDFDDENVDTYIEVKNINSFALFGFNVKYDFNYNTVSPFTATADTASLDANFDAIKKPNEQYKKLLCNLINKQLSASKYNPDADIISELPLKGSDTNKLMDIMSYVSDNGTDIIPKFPIKSDRKLVASYFKQHFKHPVSYVNVGDGNNSQLYIVDLSENPLRLFNNDGTELPDFLSNFRSFVRLRIKMNYAHQSLNADPRDPHDISKRKFQKTLQNAHLYAELVIEPKLIDKSSLTNKNALPVCRQ